jgi:hypothetical protein
MTEVREFLSAVRRDEPIIFKLDGVEVGFNPPKEAIYVLASPFEWLDQGLNAYDRSVALGEIKSETPEEEAEQRAAIEAPDWRGPGVTEINRRLRDPSEPLDIADLEEVIAWLREQVAGRPTT